MPIIIKTSKNNKKSKWQTNIIPDSFNAIKSNLSIHQHKHNLAYKNNLKLILHLINIFNNVLNLCNKNDSEPAAT